MNSVIPFYQRSLRGWLLRFKPTLNRQPVPRADVERRLGRRPNPIVNSIELQRCLDLTSAKYRGPLTYGRVLAANVIECPIKCPPTDQATGRRKAGRARGERCGED